jgi:predicted nucleic acid binding AN1-type Zn finger protein
MENKKINPSKKYIKKCNICKKKNIINITCSKCNNNFCIKHQCPENHNCSHDYKKDFKIIDKIIKSKIEVI